MQTFETFFVNAVEMSLQSYHSRRQFHAPTAGACPPFALHPVPALMTQPAHRFRWFRGCSLLHDLQVLDRGLLVRQRSVSFWRL